MSAIVGNISTSVGCTKKPNIMPESEADEAVVPDSTTPLDKERPAFLHGQDVLLKHKDGRYYLGTVVEVDTIREQCLVKFGDNTQSWSTFKDLTKLSMTDEDPWCVVCKSVPKEKNEVTVCDKCGRGYHQQCHQPRIPPDCQKDGATWKCKKCVDIQQIRDIRHRSESARILRKESIRKICSGVDTASTPPLDKSKLPYDPDMLNWDTYHRVNIEQIYCYCGRNGEWYTQMLQCGRCKQWFHEKCVRCLKYPLYCGDRFYVFVCSICNYGKEFLRRLELKWVDLVHLMLFNLTAFNVKKYYDLDTVIIPYVNDNWHALQLPPKIYSVSKAERRENILSVLTNNRNRFKCGREIKKRTTIWGLRVRLPPPAPCVTLPSTGAITEEGLRERWEGNKRLQFLSQSEIPILTIKTEPVPSDTMQVIMRGTAYQSNSNLSENESSSPSPSPVSLPATPNSIDDNNLKLYKMDYHGGGFVKKSLPFPKISVQRRKRLLSINMRERDKILRRPKPKRKITKNENSQLNMKDSRFKKTRRLLKSNLLNSSDNTIKCEVIPDDEEDEDVDITETEINCDFQLVGEIKVEDETLIKVEALPLTPPTSVSAPPTPPANSTPISATGNNDTSPDFTLNSAAQNLSNLNNKTHPRSNKAENQTTSVELNTPCDTSGDETSSKSTLDLIIPPPKDFEGKNNPFHTLLKTSPTTPSPAMVSKPRPSITLPLPLTAVIPSAPLIRPAKRQLSEKDICIGPNGEVKRRRLRRGRAAAAQLAALAAMGQPTASKTATVLPARPDGKEWSQRNLRSTLQQQQQSQIGNCVDYALNGRRLRQRADSNKSQQDTKNKTLMQPTPKLSPVKQEPDINMDDLKSSVNIYFGAANRIAAGERFGVKAKRVGPQGKIQYLIEWEGPSQGMT